jgi:CDP-6-deoxy-D-xylo-4-hexulose-3-dehydrase
MSDSGNLREEILALVRRYADAEHRRPAFVPGETRVTYSGRVYDAAEMTNLVSSALDFWLTAGPYADKFEKRMQEFFGSRDFVLVNSGSSANLLMVSTLCAEELDRIVGSTGPPRLRPGDEVITPAVTFPTTLTPIVQNRLIPVFVDCRLETYNVDADLVEDAIGPKTRAIFIPHTLGLPFEVDRIAAIAEKHGLWLLEDGCDALGATFDGKLVGTFGAMSSLSFYPAHHITMGEGGGVAINHPRLKKTARSIRDWGRDCYCDPGKSDTCGKRFGWQLGELPHGYDHKYIYSNLGYNLKATDLQAAIGLAQTDKISRFVEARRRNFAALLAGLADLKEFLILPEIHPKANPSPFGFPVTVRDGIERRDLVRHLEEAKIETRLVFGGNILRQPGFRSIEHRVHGTMRGADTVMEKTLFVGVFPGLSPEAVDYVIERFHAFFATRRAMEARA